ncbi:Arv1-like family-domain-containing protein [Dioszegia hungarica]|uniref:Protein ARV n=1 Tax=Dioszegia hungarica TaxID=4972 RepID=A0AA38HD09_9TREE|nr:Arv1-like family-domain-containing protein [Dioszegia hungarica]KAI9638837.1 Arv1-like family-domain-containing protein [Dioszegia hungarica]
MPVCTTCAHPAEYLYTTYRTKSNIRLGVCPRCSAFLDPLIEHPPLLLILDLILLKPRVFLHLLYNRGTRPLDATAPSINRVVQTAPAGPDERETVLRQDLVRLVFVTILAEALVRIGASQGGLAGRSEGKGGIRCVWPVSGILLGVMAEMAVQYGVTLILGLSVLWARGWWTPAPGTPSERVQGSGKAKAEDGRKANFRPILIPLTLLYTSILPLLLHLLLSIWYSPPTHPSSSTPLDTLHLPSMLTDNLPLELISVMHTLHHLWNTTDRIWAGTRLLGGMSAGFGLRVVLPTRPWETTGIVSAGWGAAAAVGWVLQGPHISVLV